MFDFLKPKPEPTYFLTLELNKFECYRLFSGIEIALDESRKHRETAGEKFPKAERSLSETINILDKLKTKVEGIIKGIE